MKQSKETSSNNKKLLLPKAADDNGFSHTNAATAAPSIQTEEIILMDRTIAQCGWIWFFCTHKITVSISSFFINRLFVSINDQNTTEKNSNEKITKMSHNTRQFFGSFSIPNAFFVRLGAHEFIYYKFSGPWYSIINSHWIFVALALRHNTHWIFKRIISNRKKQNEKNFDFTNISRKKKHWSKKNYQGQYFVSKNRHINWITIHSAHKWKKNTLKPYFSQLSTKYYYDFHVFCSASHQKMIIVFCCCFNIVSNAHKKPKIHRKKKRQKQRKKISFFSVALLLNAHRKEKQTVQQPRTMRLHLFLMVKTDQLT